MGALGARARVGRAVLRTERLTLAPLESQAEHWERHGFGDWAIEHEGAFAGPAVRGPGLTRDGSPMTVYLLRAS